MPRVASTAWLGFLLGACVIASLAGQSTACTVFKFDISGFAANVRHLLLAYGVLSENGTIFLDNRNFPYKCTELGGWHDFFDSEPIIKEWTPKAEAAALDAPCRHVDKAGIAKIVDRIRIPWTQYEELAISKAWVLRPWVAVEVSQHLAVLEAAAKPTIALHIRGGDKVAEDQQEEIKRATTFPEDYVETFVSRFPDVQGGTCIILGDDHAWVAEASRLAQERINCTLQPLSPFYRQEGHKQAQFNSLPYEERCEQSMRLLTDMEIMAHADYFVGTFNSGMPWMIDTMRHVLYGKHRSTMADASIHHWDWYERIREYYREYAEEQVACG
ncbi:hypothetical protein WJX81_002183 [Elliptochloris bilobata]|uniref:O-fucosyltransferase family protein n=1 Tax=Elliptochloris bilobata TaxID=381761 RepID=A0AAW1S3H1_9CHLO